MKIFKHLFIAFFAVLMLYACQEEGRFEINDNDKTVPGVPVVTGVKPLSGGARIYYNVPNDEQLLQIVAEIEASNGKIFKFSASYFKDSLDVWGLGENREYTFNIWAETRAGVRSALVPVTVTPNTASIWHVKDAIVVNPGFGGLILDWKNPEVQTVNVFVDLDFMMNGEKKELGLVYSSNADSVHQVIPDLPAGENVNVSIRVEDIYGNTTDKIVKNEIKLLSDTKIPKKDINGNAKWILPKTNDSIDWIPMCFGDGANGRLERVIDDLIDFKDGSTAASNNYMHATNMGRTGVPGVLMGNIWNLIIDLGDYWHISRVVTHQRWDYTISAPRSNLYQGENVGRYALWVLDEDLPGDRIWDIYGEEVSGTWVKISEHYVPIPVGLAAIEYVPLGVKGDEAYMFPQKPGYTKPVRWFRYEALSGINSVNNVPYSSTDSNCLSEITLYGLPAGSVDEGDIIR